VWGTRFEVRGGEGLTGDSSVSARSERRGVPVKGHSVGCGGRLAVRGRVGGVVRWPEVPVHVEALLRGKGGACIFEDAPRCGAVA
jgi:hypothetical protein